MAPSDESKQRMPRHVAIIMDGNGRWAAMRGLPRIEGHRRGVEAVESCCAELRVTITLQTLGLGHSSGLHSEISSDCRCGFFRTI